MSGHTPGPWTNEGFWPSKNGAEITHGSNDVGAASAVIAKVTIRRTWRAEQEANARLIAAAPELLEACETFAEWLRREEAGFDHQTHNRETPEGEDAWREWFYGNLDICRDAQEKVRAAIAKARGES